MQRRDFLKVVVGMVAASTVGCTPREHLPSDLAALVNEIGIEGMNRQKAEDNIRRKSPYSSAFHVLNYMESDWRNLVLEEVLYEMVELPKSASYFRNHGRKQEEMIKAESPLRIMGLSIVDDVDVREGFKGRIWGAGDELSIHVEYNDRYQDTFKFLAQNDVREPVVGDTKSYSRSSAIDFVSKKQNIENIKKAYNITEAEAKAKLEGWLPKLLATAHKLYVPPQYFPQESWLPDNNLVRRKVSDYMYRAKGK